MTGPDLDAYLLCATPRSGSTLLCGLLTSCGVAGRPASYFNRDGLHHYATDWQLERPTDGRIDAAYLQAALRAGRTPNGVFGGRVMAGSMPPLLADLAAAAPGPPSRELDLLTGVFGRLRFVHLRRADVVGQAVSWAKALQTHFWHPGEAVEPGGQDPQYDEALIARLVASIEGFEAWWQTWFTNQGISPYEVTYEQLAADPVATAQEVIADLGLHVPDDRPLAVGHRRQADEVNADWVQRFSARR